MAPSIPDRIGPYEITGQLGAGGMGVVYRARDTRLGREVALKILPEPPAGDTSLQARFEQEARAASALNHPNLVAVYDVGRHEGLSFIVCELVKGESLRQLISRGPVPPERVCALGMQIADGVAAAHAAGIIHRDVKPENIMTAADGRIKILDFGLAKNTHVGIADTDETALQMTQPGLIMGTPRYMSPEQARGESADFRSDIFSLGAVLYELATANRAFQGNSTIELMHAILNEEPRKMPKEVPRNLAAVILRCLEKDPSRRYQRAEDLRLALQSIADDRSAALSSVDRRAGGWTKLAAALVLAAAGAGAAYWSTHREQPQSKSPSGGGSTAAPVTASPVQPPRPEVVSPPQPLTTTAKTTEAVVRTTKPAPGPRVSPANRAAAAAAYDEALALMVRNAPGASDHLDEAIRLDPANAAAWRLRGTAFLQKGQSARAIADLTEAITLAPRDDLAFRFRSASYRAEHESDKALQDANEAVRLKPDRADAHAVLGMVHFDLAQYDKALEDFDASIQLSALDERVSVFLVTGLPARYSWRGDTHVRMRQGRSALQDFNRALELRPGFPGYLERRARVKQTLGDLEGAAADQRLARQQGGNAAAGGDGGSTAPATDPAKTKALWQAAYDQGMQQFREKKYGTAAARFGEAIRIDPQSAPSWRGRGLSYYWLTEYDHAVPDLNEAIRLYPADDNALSFRGEAYRHLRDYEKALADAAEVIRRKPEVATSYFTRGAIFLEQRRYQEARDEFDKAIPRAASPPLRSQYYAQRALAKEGLGDRDGAEADRRAARGGQD